MADGFRFTRPPAGLQSHTERQSEPIEESAWLLTTRAWVALSRTRRASRFQGLLLLGRQDLVELGFGLFFEFGDLFFLVVREFHLLDDERWEQMEAATRTTAAAWSIPARLAARTVALFLQSLLDCHAVDPSAERRAATGIELDRHPV